jgi:flagella basal body P-ring formation protein FlgA
MSGAALTALLVTLLAPSATASAKARVEQMVSGAVRAAAQPGDRVTIDGMRLFVNKACKVGEASVAQRLQASGRVGVRLVGERPANKAERKAGKAGKLACSGFAWAQVRVKRRVLVLDKDVERGEALSDVVVHKVVELKQGRQPLTALSPGAVASRQLKAGQPLMTFMVRAQEAKPGAQVPVHIVVGNIRMVVQGTAVRCGLRHACARLGTGQLVKGRAEGRAVVVEGGLR